MKTANYLLSGMLLFSCLFTVSAQKKYSKKQIEKLKNEAASIVEANHKQSQVMVDKIFSFAELGFADSGSGYPTCNGDNYLYYTFASDDCSGDANDASPPSAGTWKDAYNYPEVYKTRPRPIGARGPDIR